MSNYVKRSKPMSEKAGNTDKLALWIFFSLSYSPELHERGPATNEIPEVPVPTKHTQPIFEGDPTLVLAVILAEDLFKLDRIKSTLRLEKKKPVCFQSASLPSL
jgi:hypothetical protein